MRFGPLILLLAFVAAALSFPLSDTDVWWHLAAGRAMVDGLSWLRDDPFCVSSLGAPWIDLHWGFQLLALAWHRAGGDAALVVLRAGLVATALYVSLRGRAGWGPALVAIILVFATRTFLDLRPLLVSLLAFALLWRLLERIPSPGVLFGAMGLQIVLVNTQGLFLLGPLFALASAFGALLEGRRRVAAAHFALVALLALASLANPWGWHAFELATKVAGRIAPTASNLFSREIPENLPLHLWIAQRPSRILPLLWAALGAALFFRRGPGSPARALLLLGALLLACMAVRNLPLAALALLFSLEPRRLGPRPLLPALAILVAAALSVPAFAERRWNDPSTSVAPLRLPDSTTLALLRREPGPVFHEIRAGGWLSWHLPHRTACWCDTRLVLHDAPFVADYLDILRRPDRFEAWSRARGFRFALLPLVEMPDARPLAARLFASKDWKLVDCDGAWALFARPDVPLEAFDWRLQQGRAAILARLHARLGDNSRLERLATENLDALLADAGATR